MRYARTPLVGVFFGRVFINPDDSVETELVFRAKTANIARPRIDDGDLRDSRRLMPALDRKGYVGPRITPDLAEALKRSADAYAQSPLGRKRTIRLAERGGWSDDLSSFQYAEAELPSGRHVPRVARSRARVVIARKGSLEGWTQTVPVLAQRSSSMMLFLSAAFAAPTLRLLRDGPDNFGFNLWGLKGTGKTTSLEVARSVMSSQCAGTWDATLQGIQDLAREMSDLPLTVDAGENADDDKRATIMDSFAYKATKGQARLRSTASSAEHGADFGNYRSLYLSTHERETPGTRQNGAADRFIDIPVPAASETSYGVIDYIAPGKPPKVREAIAFRTIKEIEAAVDQHYGHALPAFIKRLCDDTASARERLNGAKAVFLDHPDFSELETSRRRVLDRFAICYAAGCLAITFGLVPWTEAHLSEAIRRCARAAFARPTDEDTVVERDATRIITWLDAPERKVLRLDRNLTPQEIGAADYLVGRASGMPDDAAFVLPETLRAALALSEPALTRAVQNLHGQGLVIGPNHRTCGTVQQWFKRRSSASFRRRFYRIQL